jgi:hypothetical protein
LSRLFQRTPRGILSGAAGWRNDSCITESRTAGFRKRACNGHQTPSGDWDERAAMKDERKEKDIENKISMLCDPFDCKPRFGGDPRGSTIKIVMPDGYTNDWGGEGICVPTA